MVDLIYICYIINKQAQIKPFLCYHPRLVNIMSEISHIWVDLSPSAFLSFFFINIHPYSLLVPGNFVTQTLAYFHLWSLYNVNCHHGWSNIYCYKHHYLHLDGTLWPSDPLGKNINNTPTSCTTTNGAVYVRYCPYMSLFLTDILWTHWDLVR